MSVLATPFWPMAQPFFTLHFALFIRRDERRLAEQRTTKHQLQARNSCLTDGRSYRVARRLPVPAPARFDWKTLIPVEQLNKIRSACFKKFRDHQFKRWVSAKKAASRNLFHLLRGLTR